MGMFGAFVIVFFIVVGGGALMTTIALLLTPSEKLVAPINERVTCAACGKKFHREHCVPVNRNSAIVWLCEHDAARSIAKAS